jgi:hypothetical protein
MKKMLMVVMACYAFTARSQVDQSKNFIYLNSDSVIYAGTVSLRPDLLDSWTLRVDRRKIPTEHVKFVSNQDGFFARTSQPGFVSAPVFAERIIEGKINVFREISYDQVDYDWRYRHMPVANTQVNARNYYNRGFGDLKKLNYKNLNKDMADDTQSMDLLKNYRKSITRRNVLYTAAGASVVAGFVSLLASAGNERSRADFMSGKSPSIKRPAFLPMVLSFGAGIGFGIGGFALHKSSARTLENAIDMYNR